MEQVAVGATVGCDSGVRADSLTCTMYHVSLGGRLKAFQDRSSAHLAGRTAHPSVPALHRHAFLLEGSRGHVPALRALARPRSSRLCSKKERGQCGLEIA